MRFYWSLSFWAPTWHPLGAFLAPKTPSNPRKKAQRPSRTTFGAREPPEALQRPSGFRFWTMFESAFERSRMDFDRPVLMILSHIWWSIFDAMGSKLNKKIALFSQLSACDAGGLRPPFLTDPFSVALPFVGQLQPWFKHHLARWRARGFATLKLTYSSY